jgi:hypothetical protein
LPSDTASSSSALRDRRRDASGGKDLRVVA